jgi:hypothetical protein
MSAADDALAEILAATEALKAPHEGLRDFARLNLTAEAHAEVDASIQQYDRRRALLGSAESAIGALIADGYPALPPNEVPTEVLAILAENQKTITAALATFALERAAHLGLAPGEIETK